MQDKRNEIAFFDAHASADDYNVFSESANARLIDTFVRRGLEPGARVVDLGCGSGIFTYLLSRRGYDAAGSTSARNFWNSRGANIQICNSTKATSKRSPTRKLRWTAFY